MRILVLSMAALFVWSLSSCTKENVTVSGPAFQEELPWQDPLNDMDHAYQETMEALEPLKKLSEKDAEALKNSTDLPADLAKLGVDVEAFQRHAQRFTAAIQEARNLGASDEILVASIKKHSEPVVRKIEAAYPEVANAKSTPCYDAYETRILDVIQNGVDCATLVRGWGWVICAVWWAMEMDAAHAAYVDCLDSTYGG